MINVIEPKYRRRLFQLDDARQVVIVCHQDIEYEIDIEVARARAQAGEYIVPNGRVRKQRLRSQPA